MNALTNSGLNIFYIAACNSNSDVLQYLLTNYSSMVEQTADQNAGTALHEACISGILQNVKLLFECADIKSFDKGDINGTTPLHAATYHGHHEIVKYILSQSEVKSIDINKVDILGQTPEDVARILGHTKVLEMFEMWRFKSEFKR